MENRLTDTENKPMITKGKKESRGTDQTHGIKKYMYIIHKHQGYIV